VTGADGVTQKTRTIGVVTGGGDCPGLNAVIRAVVRTAKLQHGWRVIGIANGFNGLIWPEQSRELTLEAIRGTLPRGTLATRFGYYAVELMARGEYDRMVCLRAGEIRSVPSADAIGSCKLVDPESDYVRAARAVGITFGDRP
jgi:6-phosphofructokinase